MTQGAFAGCLHYPSYESRCTARTRGAGSAAVVLGRGKPGERAQRTGSICAKQSLYTRPWNKNHPPRHGTKIIRPASLTPNPPTPCSLDIGTASRGLGEGPGRAHYSGRRKHGHGHCGGTAWHFPEAQGVCAGRQAGLGDVRGHDSIVEQGGDAEGRGPAIDWWIGRGGVPELFWESGK